MELWLRSDHALSRLILTLRHHRHLFFNYNSKCRLHLFISSSFTIPITSTSLVSKKRKSLFNISKVNAFYI